MELLKLGSKKIKLVIMGILIILIMGNNSLVYDVDYHFVEDFSGVPDEDWKFSAWFYSPSGGYVKTDHTFTNSDELISSGEPDGNVTNYATINDTTAFGAWSFDIFIPSDQITNYWDTSFSIEWNYLKLNSYFKEPGGADWPEFILDGYGEGLRFQAWNETKDPSSNLHKIEHSTSGLKFNTYQHIDVIRTSVNFYVYIDGELIMDIEFSSNLGTEINYFTVEAAKGSGVKYDNIAITTDAQGLLDSLLNPPSTSGITEDTNSKSTDDSLFFAAGTGIVALIGTVSYWRLSKKKH